MASTVRLIRSFLIVLLSLRPCPENRLRTIPRTVRASRRSSGAPVELMARGASDQPPCHGFLAAGLVSDAVTKRAPCEDDGVLSIVNGEVGPPSQFGLEQRGERHGQLAGDFIRSFEVQEGLDRGLALDCPRCWLGAMLVWRQGRGGDVMAPEPNDSEVADTEIGTYLQAFRDDATTNHGKHSSPQLRATLTTGLCPGMRLLRGRRSS